MTVREQYKLLKSQKKTIWTRPGLDVLEELMNRKDLQRYFKPEIVHSSESVIHNW